MAETPTPTPTPTPNPASTPAPTPNPADSKGNPPAPAADGKGTSLLQGAKGDVTTPSAEEQAAIDAENKRLIDADENTLSDEDKTKRAELIKARDDKAANSIPDKYIFKMPEGMTENTALTEAISPVLKKLGITQAGAQELIDAYAPVIKKQAEEERNISHSQFKEMVTGWGKDTMKALSENGADAAKELAIAARARDMFASPELLALLSDEQTGIGNHVEMVKMFIKIGKMISSDTFPGGRSQGGRDESLEGVAKRMYPTMHQGT